MGLPALEIHGLVDTVGMYLVTELPVSGVYGAPTAEGQGLPQDDWYQRPPNATRCGQHGDDSLEEPRGGAQT